jgi:hypothetical protein
MEKKKTLFQAACSLLTRILLGVCWMMVKSIAVGMQSCVPPIAFVQCTLRIFTTSFSLVAAKQVPAKKAESSSEDSDESSDDEEEAPKPAAKKVAAPVPATQKRKHDESSEDSSDDDKEEEDAKHKSVSV